MAVAMRMIAAEERRRRRSRTQLIASGELIAGRTINTSKGFETVPWFAQSMGCGVAQIYLGGSKNYQRRARPDAVLAAFADDAERRGVRIVVHSSNLINLARQQDHDVWRRSLDCLVTDLQSSVKLRALGVVVHLGCAVGQSISDAEANYVAGILEALLRAPGSRVIIETSAHEGSEIAHNIIDLARLANRFPRSVRDRIGFCIDTCHIFAAGYDVSSTYGANVFLESWDALIGLDRVVCFHMNDSLGCCGSRLDRHVDIGAGEIWRHDKTGLRRICQEAYRRRIPLILETPARDLPNVYQLALFRFLLFNNDCDDVQVIVKGSVRCTGLTA
jgi:deoxyribonuclease-4